MRYYRNRSRAKHVQFEEDVILPYFRQFVATENTYGQNSLWIDCTVDTDVGELRIKGSTDPAIVDRDGEPILVSEIKTKSSVSDLDAPNKHHKAQVHAYLFGLSEKYERDLTNGVIIYGGRDTLDVRTFPVEFDPDFWTDTVVKWATNLSEYRLDHELPPADPEFDWECEFCSFKNRCGKGDLPIADTGPAGLLPKYNYPQEKVKTYLEAHPAAKLTPSLAQRYSSLADNHEVYDWHCPHCEASYAWDELSVKTADASESPLCPDCLKNGRRCRVRGPLPKDQHEANWEGNYE